MMTLPLEKLDDKTFDDLVRDAISRISIYSPQWTDHNRTDPGITLIELLAWIVEMQIYRLDRVNQKSIRKFLKLVGVPSLRAASPARVDVTFSPRRRGIGPHTVKMGTEVAAWDSMEGKDIPFETERDLTVLDIDLRRVITVSHNPRKDKPPDNEKEIFRDNFADNENENVYYYAFGDDPKEEDALYLGFQFDESSAGQELTLAFYLNQDMPLSSSDLEEIGQYMPAVLKWECYLGGEWTDDNNWRTLDPKDVVDETSRLLYSGKIRIIIPADAKKVPFSGKNTSEIAIFAGDDQEELFWIRCKIDKAGYETPPMIDKILPNTVSATQVKTFYRCEYSSSGLPGVQLNLKDTPINKIWYVRVNEVAEWTEIQDFDASTPGDNHYVLDRNSGIITFGDGVNGRIPPNGDHNITIKYSSGGGVKGNVPPHSINKVIGIPAEFVSVDNQRAGQDGSDPGTLEEAIASAKKSIKEISRAVTSEDYEYLAKNTPGIKIARARALPRYHPNMKVEVPNAVTVIVIPDSSDPLRPINHDLLRTVYRHLDRYRLLTTELFVLPPEYVQVSVKATLAIMKGHNENTIKNNAIKALNDFLDPLKGGADGKGWPFGRPMYQSEIFRVLDGVDGVDYVSNVTLFKWGVPQDGDIHLSAHELLFSEPCENRYFFSWNEVPGRDSARLIEILNQSFSINWAKDAKIEKTDGDMTIRISTNENSINLKLNDTKTEAILEIPGDKTVKLIAQSENSETNIYLSCGHKIDDVHEG